MSAAGKLQDASIASLSGSSQSLLAATIGSRQFLQIQNSGNANISINMTGGTAAAGAGCITLAAGGSLTFDVFVPQNALTVIGTAGQPVTCFWA